MKIIVTGCAGFIGSHLTEYLVKCGYEVLGLDNLSTGKKKFMSDFINKKNFVFQRVDLYKSNINKYFANAKTVFHLAANADVKNGFNNPDKDLKQNTIVTFKILEAMRINKVKNIYFSSTGSIYGEPDTFPTKEDAKFPIQTSLYGSSKLACEGLIQAYSKGYNLNAFIFRFVSIFGPRYTHGHLFDFYKKLKKNPNILNVLGDGSQRKSYLHVKDLVDGMIRVSTNWVNKRKIDIYNLGPSDDGIYVKEIAEIVCRNFGNHVKIDYGISNKGWIGDVPKFYYDINKISDEIGWTPSMNSEQAITRASAEIYEQLHN